MASIEVAPRIHLDGRLALFHGAERWLAVADTHYGYSETMRRAGGLFPLWGNETLLTRLEALCADYRPASLIIAGDLVHGRVCRDAFSSFLRCLESLAPELILIRGNHDRSPTVKEAPFVDSCQRGAFFFHHGHLDLTPPPGATEITGHWHPAISWRDGAGLALKFPAFVQEGQRWILPAFSPWAGGTAWKCDCAGKSTRRWLCSPKRVFEIVELSGKRREESFSPPGKATASGQ